MMYPCETNWTMPEAQFPDDQVIKKFLHEDFL